MLTKYYVKSFFLGYDITSLLSRNIVRVITVALHFLDIVPSIYYYTVPVNILNKLSIQIENMKYHKYKGAQSVKINKLNRIIDSINNDVQ